ncbi:MAG: hypothetical protein ACP6IP_06875 [Candidatus Njordarchaeia archaeon]
MFLTKSKTILKVLAYIALIFSLYSLSISMVGLTNDSAPYSILNTNSDGLSETAKILKQMGLETKIITSSLKSLSRINESALLVIMAPSLPYDIEESINLLHFMLTGGSILIVDDFGRANTLLNNIWEIISMGTMFMGNNQSAFKGIYFNTTAIVADAANYYITPINPVITSFSDQYGITQGIHKILTLSPASLSIKVTINGEDTFVPMPYGLLQSSRYSWLETNISEALNGNLSPDPWEWGGLPFSLGLAFSFGNNKIALISDPDIFSNKALKIAKEEGYDNIKFVQSLFKWLTSPNIKLVIFDESHSAHLPTDAIYGLSLWLKILSEASSSWYIGPILPIFLFSIITGYLPKERPTSTILMSKVERVTEESPFKRRLKWYKKSKDYKNAVNLSVKYLLFEIGKKYGVRDDDLGVVFRQLLVINREFSKYSELFDSFAQEVKLIEEGKKKLKKEKDFVALMEKFMDIKRALDIH